MSDDFYCNITDLHPHLIYGIEFWGHAPDYTSIELLEAQWFHLKVICPTGHYNAANTRAAASCNQTIVIHVIVIHSAYIHHNSLYVDTCRALKQSMSNLTQIKLPFWAGKLTVIHVRPCHYQSHISNNYIQCKLNILSTLTVMNRMFALVWVQDLFVIFIGYQHGDW